MDMCVQGDESDGAHGAPRVAPFLAACKGLMSVQTTFLLAFEHRSSSVRSGLLAALHSEFPCVKRVPASAWRRAIECEHIEMYMMTLQPGSRW